MLDRIQAMSVTSDSTIRESMKAIDRGALGTAIVVEPHSGRFEAVVTDGDIRRALIGGAGLDSPLRGIRRSASKTAPIGTPPGEIASLFSDRVRVIPLLDEDGCVADLVILDRRIHLPVSQPSLGERELQYVTDCILTGWISSAGSYVRKFEGMFAEFCGTTHARATSSGTTALHLAFLALDVEPGDEVIVPTLSFIASANAVAYTGARPVFVDCEAHTWNLDPEKVEAAVTPRTRAIMAVHLYGHPADMDPIMEIANRHGLGVVEDAAEAHGALYRGRPVGSIGDLGVFSFYGNKIVTTGEGGMVVSDRADLIERIEILRDHGMSRTKRYSHPILGYNYRLTNLQAAVGVAQMERVSEILEAKRRMAHTYEETLRGVPGIVRPPAEPWAENVYWLYSVLVDDGSFPLGRDALMDALRREGIETRPFFTPLHRQPIYDTRQDLPVAQYLSANGLSLPSATNLRVEDVERVARAISRIGTTGHAEPRRLS